MKILTRETNEDDFCFILERSEIVQYRLFHERCQKCYKKIKESKYSLIDYNLTSDGTLVWWHHKTYRYSCEILN